MADNMDYIRIFAKIESIEGVEHLPSLLPFCDEIVIARGDLGNAIPLPNFLLCKKDLHNVPPCKKTFYGRHTDARLHGRKPCTNQG